MVYWSSNIRSYMKTIRVGLAGCGFIGSIHARSLVLAKNSTLAKQVNVELVVAADNNPERVAVRLAACRY
jgi:predicted dehydrogenase